ncbi:MAG: hypothetical protein JRJ34_09225 [Deltaproteobacteria bacterium]|nr:hypothetical protein [Deltaproteobacteria bacterium]
MVRPQSIAWSDPNRSQSKLPLRSATLGPNIAGIIWEALAKKISKVLKNIDTDDNLAAFEAWEKYLNRSLSFPFETKISDCQTKGPLQQGDNIRIHSIWGNEDLYGVIVKLRYDRKTFHFPTFHGCC